MPYDKVMMYMASITDYTEEDESKEPAKKKDDKVVGYMNLFDYGTNNNKV